MKENNFERKGSSPHMVDHLKRFFENSPDEALLAIESALQDNPELTKSEIFLLLSKRKGNRKNHASKFQGNQYQGELKRS